MPWRSRLGGRPTAAGGGGDLRLRPASSSDPPAVAAAVAVAAVVAVAAAGAAADAGRRGQRAEVTAAAVTSSAGSVGVEAIGARGAGAVHAGRRRVVAGVAVAAVAGIVVAAPAAPISGPAMGSEGEWAHGRSANGIGGRRGGSDGGRGAERCSTRASALGERRLAPDPRSRRALFAGARGCDAAALTCFEGPCSRCRARVRVCPDATARCRAREVWRDQTRQRFDLTSQCVGESQASSISAMENPAGKSALANRRRANRRALSHHLGAPPEAPTDAGEGE